MSDQRALVNCCCALRHQKDTSASKMKLTYISKNLCLTGGVGPKLPLKEKMEVL